MKKSATSQRNTCILGIEDIEHELGNSRQEDYGHEGEEEESTPRPKCSSHGTGKSVNRSVSSVSNMSFMSTLENLRTKSQVAADFSTEFLYELDRVIPERNEEVQIIGSGRLPLTLCSLVDKEEVGHEVKNVSKHKEESGTNTPIMSNSMPLSPWKAMDESLDFNFQEHEGAASDKNSLGQDIEQERERDEIHLLTNSSFSAKNNLKQTMSVKSNKSITSIIESGTKPILSSERVSISKRSVTRKHSLVNVNSLMGEGALEGQGSNGIMPLSIQPCDSIEKSSSKSSGNSNDNKTDGTGTLGEILTQSSLPSFSSSIRKGASSVLSITGVTRSRKWSGKYSFHKDKSSAVRTMSTAVDKPSIPRESGDLTGDDEQSQSKPKQYKDKESHFSRFKFQRSRSKKERGEKGYEKEPVIKKDSLKLSVFFGW